MFKRFLLRRFADRDLLAQNWLSPEIRLGEQVAKTDVLLVVIGPQWAQEMAARAGSKDDFVRIEVEAALNRGIRVIPILAGGASMPAAEGLPESVLPLRQRNALTVDSGRDFGVHLGRLIEAIDPPKPVSISLPTAVQPSSDPGHPAGAVQTGPHGIELVWCPPGTFLMSSPPDEAERRDDETQHEVTLTKRFWIGKYPVTQAQWKAVMKNNPSRFKGTFLLEGNPRHPVEQVRWHDAAEFCRSISSAQWTYRLPTEAEWEYACRAGTTGQFNAFGATADLAWISKNSDKKTHPVGQKKPNAWGLYDMHGNVWEWCQDWRGEYPPGPTTDPNGSPSGTHRVNRGGSFRNSPTGCRSAYRGGAPALLRDSNLGFRVAAVLVPASTGRS